MGTKFKVRDLHACIYISADIMCFDVMEGKSEIAVGIFYKFGTSLHDQFIITLHD